MTNSPTPLMLSRIPILLAVTFCVPMLLMGQRIVDQNKGNHNEAKKGYMDGNLAATVYYNFGEIADWLNDASRSGVWPKGTNHTYVDGVAIIVQAETKDPSGKTIHPLETNYYEYTRHNVSNGVTYGWWPLSGYANRFQNSPALSTDAATWPPHWPDRPVDWDNQWNGFFGKGVFNADLETFFVMDDNEDREYALANHFHPDANDTTRGGLGMQVHARGFQWSQVLAEDVIFWHYEITNMGTTDYNKTVFAQYVDWGVGGHDNSSNNSGDYNAELNLSYAWSTVNFGSPGNWSPVGYAGYAFLESPGISDDIKDNDHDGLTDERRDNIVDPVAGKFITDPSQDPYLKQDIQADTAAFRTFYGYGWKPHWDADENANWRSYTDMNANGKWDSGEPLNDDVGSDGIGPFDDGYSGPDPDGSEGNGRPDQGEPNFGILDKDESDQIGLTGFLISAVHTYDLNNDERNWTALTSLPQPHGQTLIGVNLANHFSSYFFHLNGRSTYSTRTGQVQPTGETERFSMAMIYGLGPDDLFRRKRTVQQIYNANYHFAKPPDKPTVHAIAGDHRVTLYWDDRAERTFDAFYQRYNFEGYRIYRSTEPNFLEDKIITDAFGRPTYRQPIAQFDLIDSVKGLHPIGVEGAYFYLGNDSGLKHAFTDTTVQNGQTYYYAVVPYDKGFTTTTITGEFIGIPPTEATSVIKTDLSGRVKTDINTAVVIPAAPAAGYVSPNVTMQTISGPGTGNIKINVLDPDSIATNHVFRLEFKESAPFHDTPTPSFFLYDESAGDSVIRISKMNSDAISLPVTDGYSIDIKNDAVVSIDQDKTGWVKGNSNYVAQVGFDPRYTAYAGRRTNIPADFEITLGASGTGDNAFPLSSFSSSNPSNITVRDLTDGIDHFQFIFRDLNNDSTFGAGDAMFLVSGDSVGQQATVFATARKSWSLSLFQDTLIPPSQQRPPQPGDVFRIVTKKPFRSGEYFRFKTTGPSYSADKAQGDLKQVAVVPNPYVGAASWEPATTSTGRGDRRIYFIHLPKKCTIRIYTISGQFVQSIEHDSGVSDGQELWNLVTRDGMDVAFGVYVFHVETPDIGSTIGKFAIVK